MPVLYPYRKSEQFERYIAQFMRIFSGFQTQDGVERNNELRTRKVPVVYGNMSRIVASILRNRQKFTNQTLPFMAVNMSGIDPDVRAKRPVGHTDNLTNRRVVDPENVRTVKRMLGPGFIMNMELAIYASSNKELFDILEQILLIFNPRVTIRLDTSGYNSNYITQVELVGMQDEIQYPMGTENKVVMMTLSFSVPVRLSYPHSVDGEDIIEQIRLSILDEDTDELFIEEIIGEEIEEEDENPD